jgi:uncharacterized protein YoxC
VIEVSLVALVSAALALMVPFVILVGYMLNSLTGTLRRIETRLDRIDDRLTNLTERVAVLEERGRPQHAEA